MRTLRSMMNPSVMKAGPFISTGRFISDPWSVQLRLSWCLPAANWLHQLNKPVELPFCLSLGPSLFCGCSHSAPFAAISHYCLQFKPVYTQNKHCNATSENITQWGHGKFAEGRQPSQIKLWKWWRWFVISKIPWVA